jgi:eukaryotic-like serine/threonine-protein kinase
VVFAARQVGPYRVSDFLGSGGIAEVYRGEPVGGGESVALKVLKDPVRSPANVRRFLREGWLLRRFQHPGLPRCFAVFEEPYPCIALELLRGETLSENLRRTGPLDPSEVVRVATALLEVLDYLHSHGVVHRDLKSPNVFLSRDGRVLLMDLGLAIDPGDPVTTTLGDVLGTYAYMAPEQIAGVGVDPRSDIYSLGITLYEALSGTRPFHARGTLGYLKAHKSGKTWPLAELARDSPRWLVELVQQFMTRDPSGRPASAGVALALLTGRGGFRRDLLPPPLVGRSGPRGAIEAILDVGGAVHLSGEIGSGIGRMATYALQLAADAGAEHLAVRLARGGTSGGLATRLIDVLASLTDANIGGDEPGDVPMKGIFDALSAVSAEGVTLMLVEDLHMALPGDLDLLRAILEGISALRVVTTSLQPLDSLPGRHLVLRPLNRDSVAVLVAGLLGTSSPPDDLVALLHRESGGLPGLVVLGARELYMTGTLRAEGTGADGEAIWRLDPVATQDRPLSLRPMFQWVLSELAPRSREVLDLLAVAGEAMPLFVVIGALGLYPSGAELGELFRAGLVILEDRPDGEWVRIRRSAVIPLVVEDLAAERVQELHRTLATGLQGYDPGEWRDRQVILHQALGASPERGAEVVLEVAGDLLRSGQRRKALDLLDHLALMVEPDPRSSALSAILRGEALSDGGAWDSALSSFVAARQIALDGGPRQVLGLAGIGVARVWFESGDGQRSESALRDLLTTSGADLSAPAYLSAELLLGQIRWFRGDARAALAAFAKVRERDQGSALAAEAAALTGALLVEISRGEEAGPLLEDALRSLEERQAARPLCRAYFTLARLRCQQGRLGDALACVEEGERAAASFDLPYLEALLGVARAWVYMAAGDARAAAEVLRQRRVAGDVRSDALSRLEYRIALGDVRRALGDRHAALAAYDQAAELARRLGKMGSCAYCEGMSGVLTADAAPLTRALDTLSTFGLHRWKAATLLAGALIVGDTVALAAAVDEARKSGDRPLLLQVLHAMGGSEARHEAAGVAVALLRAAGPLKGTVESQAAIRWASGS